MKAGGWFDNGGQQRNGARVGNGAAYANAGDDVPNALRSPPRSFFVNVVPPSGGPDLSATPSDRNTRFKARLSFSNVEPTPAPPVRQRSNLPSESLASTALLQKPQSSADITPLQPFPDVFKAPSSRRAIVAPAFPGATPIVTKSVSHAAALAAAKAKSVKKQPASAVPAHAASITGSNTSSSSTSSSTSTSSSASSSASSSSSSSSSPENALPSSPSSPTAGPPSAKRHQSLPTSKSSTSTTTTRLPLVIPTPGRRGHGQTNEHGRTDAHTASAKAAVDATPATTTSFASRSTRINVASADEADDVATPSQPSPRRGSTRSTLTPSPPAPSLSMRQQHQQRVGLPDAGAGAGAAGVGVGSRGQRFVMRGSPNMGMAPTPAPAPHFFRSNNSRDQAGGAVGFRQSTHESVANAVGAGAGATSRTSLASSGRKRTIHAVLKNPDRRQGREGDDVDVDDDYNDDYDNDQDANAPLSQFVSAANGGPAAASRRRSVRMSHGGGGLPSHANGDDHDHDHDGECHSEFIPDASRAGPQSGRRKSRRLTVNGLDKDLERFTFDAIRDREREEARRRQWRSAISPSGRAMRTKRHEGLQQVAASQRERVLERRRAELDAIMHAEMEALEQARQRVAEEDRARQLWEEELRRREAELKQREEELARMHAMLSANPAAGVPKMTTSTSFEQQQAPGLNRARSESFSFASFTRMPSRAAQSNQHQTGQQPQPQPQSQPQGAPPFRRAHTAAAAGADSNNNSSSSSSKTSSHNENVAQAQQSTGRSTRHNNNTNTASAKDQASYKQSPQEQQAHEQSQTDDASSSSSSDRVPGFGRQGSFFQPNFSFMNTPARPATSTSTTTTTQQQQQQHQAASASASASESGASAAGTATTKTATRSSRTRAAPSSSPSSSPSHAASSTAGTRGGKRQQTSPVAPPPPPSAVKRRAAREVCSNSEANVNDRIEARKREIRERNAKEKEEASTKSRLHDEIFPRIKRQTERMTFEQLLVTFYPRCRLGPNPDMDTLRRNMRRAMAQYHPDKTMGMDIKEQVEAEAVFGVLLNAYEKINALCSNM